MNILETIIEEKKIEIRNKKLAIKISDLESSDFLKGKHYH